MCEETVNLSPKLLVSDKILSIAVHKVLCYYSMTIKTTVHCRKLIIIGMHNIMVHAVA